ncbi:hypothetical protein [Streptomyces sp. HB132]|uniref:hypothetical protein n=1 Tax=Streptomyces sp. HB132 TaxID=767388 RepID=UPI001D37D6C0|nr:hypothetical protein [Streptomyces sp. HB132]MBM7437853.1 hypothetical protein [Streptomyces sp. HB132]
MAFGPTTWAHGDGGATTSAQPGHLVAAEPAGSPTPTASSSSEESPLAGRQAGEGRARPGRSLAPLKVSDSETAGADTAADETAADQMPPDPDPVEVPAFTPPPEAFPEPGEAARQRQRQALDEPALRHVRDASLGSGIALVGLGLAFLAFRMRRAH